MFNRNIEKLFTPSFLLALLSTSIGLLLYQSGYLAEFFVTHTCAY